MKRAVVNFSSELDYSEFKLYAEEKNISLSRALLELAQKSLTTWKDEQLGEIALERENSQNTSYVEPSEFWDQFDA